MESLKFTQLAMGEFKLDSLADFCLNSYDNCIAIVGSSTDVYLLELLEDRSANISLPYRIKFANIPQKRPFASLLKPLSLSHIYAHSNTQASQELALDPIYVSDYSIDPPKPRILQAEWMPNRAQPTCMVLTTYGVCELYEKTNISEEWVPKQTNLFSILLEHDFPITQPLTNIKTFEKLREYVNYYFITSFCWDYTGHTIYLGTAAGYIISLNFDESLSEFKKHSQIKTTLEKITYLTNYERMLLGACVQGTIKVFKIDRENGNLEEVECLWSCKDRMACRKAFIRFNASLNSYIIIFCKSAHVLVYRLTNEGLLQSSASVYVNGIKITGIELLNDMEYIITTIIGQIICIRISCPSLEELKIDENVIQHHLDTVNMQILGICCSKNRCLWSVMLYRNKEYLHNSKYSNATAFLSVLKLNNEDSLIRLRNWNINVMDDVQDLLMAIGLDIFNNLQIDKYNEFFNIGQIKIPKILNDTFMQQMQIKLFITRNIAKHQRLRFRTYKSQTTLELDFLEPAVQILHILARLEYLQEFRKRSNLTNFQQLSIVCMQNKFESLLINLKKTINEGNTFNETTENFIKAVNEQLNLCTFESNDLQYKKEHCNICNETINMNIFNVCPKQHVIQRCSISYIQLPFLLFQKSYCPQCYALVSSLRDQLLQELFADHEKIKCTFCRFLLREDSY
uniref:Transcription factor IIIC 90kDa subunit N-terminal domain-containing protein n=1 Tax=Glossina brevipalpis TaxID=37001 RepID=A0A1A9WAW2_9MUSC